jgi:hypothetical protein
MDEPVTLTVIAARASSDERLRLTLGGGSWSSSGRDDLDVR